MRLANIFGLMTQPATVISVDKLSKCSALLFNKARFSGAEISRLLARDLSSLWTDFHKRGLTVERAVRIAAILDGWARELTACAHSLRLLATETRAEINAANKAAKNKPL